MGNKKVLFVSQDASRTGAPIILLRFLSWLRSHTDLSFQVILRKGGELEPEYRALAPLVILNDGAATSGNFMGKALRHLGLSKSQWSSRLLCLERAMGRDPVDLIYSNTITNGSLLERLSSMHCPVITHVHELDYWIRYRTGLDSFGRLKENTLHYIAVAEAVKKNLVENHGISEDRIDVIHGFIPILSNGQSPKAETYRKIREKLGLPGNALLVGACGTTDWGKGSDLFIQLARAVHQRQPKPPVYFVWIGNKSAGSKLGELIHDIKILGLEPYIQFLGVASEATSHFG